MNARWSTQMKAQEGKAEGFFSTNLLQRKCACGQHMIAGGKCESCGKQTLQRHADGQSAPAEVPAIVQEVLHTPGQPLDAETRAFMEPHFAHDFSRVAATTQSKLTVSEPGDCYEQEADQLAERVGRGHETLSLSKSSSPQAESLSPRQRESTAAEVSRVRVHTDAQAAQAAQSINARAFTLGHDIFFGSNQYAPHSANGRQLLAHEMTHVMQQRGASTSPVVARQGAEKYETAPVEFTGQKMETAAKGSYWEQKVFRAYKVTPFPKVRARFAADAEERDAVMSTLWNQQPPTLTAKTELLVNIPARAGAASSKELVYKFVFIPKAKTAPKDALDEVEVHFQAEGAAAKVTTAPTPAAGFSPSTSGLRHDGFPGGNIDAYWAAHPEEEKQVFNWIENVAPDPFDQFVTTEVKPADPKKPVQKATFQVKGKKPKGDVQDLVIDFIGAIQTAKAAPPTGYKDKDRLDLYIEDMQTKPHTKKKDKLGVIKGLDASPADEKVPVKYVIWQYFEFGETRNAEVDAIVPIMTTGKRVFYTLRFKEKNDVEVERIAEEGIDTGKKEDKGKKSLTEMDVARVRGFADNSADPAKLSTWLTKRYPGVTPKGKTVEELRQSVNTAMKTDAGSPDWFKKNYDLHVLGAADATTRLNTKYSIPASLTSDVKDFQSSDLNIVEFALQAMTEAILALIKGVRLIRKTLGFSFDKAAKAYKEDPDVGGLALQLGSEKSVLIFDKASRGDSLLFLGGKEGLRPQATGAPAHEFGHIVESQGGIKKAFSEYVAKHKLKPITWFAAKQPSEDFFTEAFALYHTDPEWMRNNQPKLYEWFEKLTKTGKPPPP